MKKFAIPLTRRDKALYQFINKKSCLPILGAYLVKDGMLRATDMQSFIEKPIEKEDGVYYDLALGIKYKNYNVNDGVAFPDSTREHIGSINKNGLKKINEYLKFLKTCVVSSKNFLPVMTSVWFEVGDVGLTKIVGTDSFSLAYQCFDTLDIKLTKGFLLPIDSVKCLFALNGCDKVQVYLSDKGSYVKFVGITDSDELSVGYLITTYALLMQATPPSYMNIIPAKSDEGVRFDIADAIKCASLVREDSLRIEDKKLKLWSSDLVFEIVVDVPDMIVSTKIAKILDGQIIQIQPDDESYKSGKSRILRVDVDDVVLIARATI